MTAPSDFQLAAAEVTALRRTVRPGDQIAVYRHPRRGGAFLYVGPASPKALAPREWRGKRLIGFAELTTCYVRPVRAGDPVEPSQARAA